MGIYVVDDVQVVVRVEFVAVVAVIDIVVAIGTNIVQ
jgi:hypothetical protein